jgi:hypothetical protein
VPNDQQKPATKKDAREKQNANSKATSFFNPYQRLTSRDREGKSQREARRKISSCNRNISLPVHFLISDSAFEERKNTSVASEIGDEVEMRAFGVSAYTW